MSILNNINATNYSTLLDAIRTSGDVVISRLAELLSSDVMQIIANPTVISVIADRADQESDSFSLLYNVDDEDIFGQIRQFVSRVQRLSINDARDSSDQNRLYLMRLFRLVAPDFATTGQIETRQLDNTFLSQCIRFILDTIADAYRNKYASRILTNAPELPGILQGRKLGSRMVFNEQGLINVDDANSREILLYSLMLVEFLLGMSAVDVRSMVNIGSDILFEIAITFKVALAQMIATHPLGLNATRPPQTIMTRIPNLLGSILDSAQNTYAFGASVLISNILGFEGVMERSRGQRPWDPIQRQTFNVLLGWLNRHFDDPDDEIWPDSFIQTINNTETAITTNQQDIQTAISNTFEFLDGDIVSRAAASYMATAIMFFNYDVISSAFRGRIDNIVRNFTGWPLVADDGDINDIMKSTVGQAIMKEFNQSSLLYSLLVDPFITYEDDTPLMQRIANAVYSSTSNYLENLVDTMLGFGVSDVTDIMERFSHNNAKVATTLNVIKRIWNPYDQNQNKQVV